MWIKGRDEIANYLNIHFKTLLSTSDPVLNYDIINLVPTSITDDENAQLMIFPTIDEINDVVFGMLPSFSPGPDGFPACFFQKKNVL